MDTKIGESTRNVAVVIYAPTSEPTADLDAAAERFASLLRSDCGAVERLYCAVGSDYSDAD